jgi:hypothetical protein
MSRVRALIFAVAFVSAVPIAAQAQQSQIVSVAPSSDAGPRVDRTATAVHNTVTPSATMLAQRKNLGQPIALMVVGGAAIIVGAVIGGDAGTIIMIGGLVALLVGLYQYVE